MMQQTFYDILDLHPTVSQEQIKERFRFLANAYHPDKFTSPEHKARAEAEFKKINEAYQILSVPAKRAEYDRRLQLSRYSRPSEQPRPAQHNHRQPTKESNDIYAIGQMIIRTIALVALFYLASFIAVRMGVGGLVMFLILIGFIYFRYFWK